jgi:Fe-S-cluster-containing dehydrogenase component
MSIDLNTCVGCNACVVACQAENNIPIVGKDSRSSAAAKCTGSATTAISPATIRRGVRRTGEGNLAESPRRSADAHPADGLPAVRERAVRDGLPGQRHRPHEEGLNVMAYNRCIGTRYCANNCPYKVRRFNFFNWNMRPSWTASTSGRWAPRACRSSSDGEEPRTSRSACAASWRSAPTACSGSSRGDRLRQHQRPESAVSVAKARDQDYGSSAT